jgi:hypothetical protein
VKNLFQSLPFKFNLQRYSTVDGLWVAIKNVWASKWNERAFLSRKACGVSEVGLCTLNQADP